MSIGNEQKLPEFGSCLTPAQEVAVRRRAALHEEALSQMRLSMRVAAWWSAFKRRHIVNDWPFGGDMQ